MAYNNGRENRKWLIWKEAEEKILREHGVDENTIEQIRTDDRADFNSNRKKGLIDGFKKYGIIGVLVAIAGFIAFYVGLSPFDRQPSIEKVLIEGVVYYIGVAIIEELYVRGLLLNLIEKMMAKNKNSTLIAVVLSAVIFGVGHIFGMLSQPLLVIVSKVVWTIGMGIFFGMVYKKTNNLWLPIIIHFLINVCALPYCFSSVNGYANLTLYIVVPTYIILGIYSFIELKKEA
jgi:membrane protease YdiL (CAAX protease family)